MLSMFLHGHIYPFLISCHICKNAFSFVDINLIRLTTQLKSLLPNYSFDFGLTLYGTYVTYEDVGSICFYFDGFRALTYLKTLHL